MTSRPPIAVYIGTWAALMILLALTCGSAYLSLGKWNTTLNLGIAAAKALLVAIFFMHLRHATALIRLFAVTAIFMLALLFGLSSGDYATRTIAPAAWTKPSE